MFAGQLGRGEAQSSRLSSTGEARLLSLSARMFPLNRNRLLSVLLSITGEVEIFRRLL